MWFCAPDLHDLADIRGVHHMSWSFTACVQPKHCVLPVHEFLTAELQYECPQKTLDMTAEGWEDLQTSDTICILWHLEGQTSCSAGGQAHNRRGHFFPALCQYFCLIIWRTV